ncbi:MAG: ATP-binding protein, partial [Gemmatimonadetes bacterium]|nr:ATP-binding protein [Gemmatimonadota bacterium]
ASLLRKNRHAVLAPRDLDMLDRIQANGRHLLALINDVLDLSKVEAGRMTLSLASVDVSAIVRQVVADAEAQLGNKPVVVRAVAPPHCVIETDEAKVRQVLVNLVANAVKFAAHGEVCVTLVDGQSLALRVSDTGIGIAADRLEAIFRPFEQAESSTSSRYGGTGLGLSISRSMAEMLGGSLEVESTPGEGTTFTFRVPVNAPAPAVAAVGA